MKFSQQSRREMMLNTTRAIAGVALVGGCRFSLSSGTSSSGKSNGKIGEMRDARDFVEGVCNLGNGNELLALSCLKKAADDRNMHTPWSSIQEPLVSFLERIDSLPENVRSTGKDVADLYGRYNPEKFRGVWEKLNVTRRSES